MVYFFLYLCHGFEHLYPFSNEYNPWNSSSFKTNIDADAFLYRINPESSERNEDYYKTRPCTRCVALVAEIVG